MSFKRFDDYAKEEGFCCPWALLFARRRWNTLAMKEDSGISHSGIRYWRNGFRKGRVRCENCANCMRVKLLSEQRC